MFRAGTDTVPLHSTLSPEARGWWTLAVVAAASLVAAVELRAPEGVPVVLAAVIPVGLAAWTFGRWSGVGVAAFAALAAPVAHEVRGALAGEHVAAALALRLVVLGAVAWLGDVAGRRVRELERASEHDPLTGLLNRRGFLRRAEVERRRASRTGAPMTIAFIDLDDFKALNDVYGHQAGDRVLAVLGEVLARGREMDLAARLGGDEFVLLMPETTKADAASAIERLRANVAAELLREGLPVSFTCGLATFTATPLGVTQLLHEADRQMYSEKRAKKGAARPKSGPHATVNVIPLPRAQ